MLKNVKFCRMIQEIYAVKQYDVEPGKGDIEGGTDDI